MHLSVNETTMPRLHLIGTLSLLLVVTLMMAGFFSWQSVQDHRASLDRIAKVIHEQQQARLTSEMRSAVDYLEFVRQRTESVLRQSAVEQVDTAMQMVEAIHAQESKHRPAAEVQQLIRETLRPARFFEGRGYFFIDDLEGRFILLPTAPQYEGKGGIDNRDDTGHYIMRGLIEAARKPRGEGFSRYRWYRPDAPQTMAEKIAYVRLFEPYQWLIGTGDYLYEWEDRQKKEAMQRLRAFRFGASGSIGLLDRDGRSLISPNNPALEGLHPHQMATNERKALEKLWATAQAGGGIVEYDWPRKRANGQELGRKTALVSTYAPWGWVLVTSMFNDELESALHAEIYAHEAGNGEHYLRLAIVLLGVTALGIMGSFVFSHWSKKLFSRYHHELEQAHADLRIAAIAFESQEGIFVTNAQGVILRVNHSFTDITGYSAEEAIGQTPSLLKSGRHEAAFYQQMQQTVTTTGCWYGEIWNRRKDGTVFPEWLTITAVKTDQGEVTHYVSTLTDITQRKAAEEEIRYLAYYDALTKLPNRRLLLDRLQQALLTSRRTSRQGALMFIDLDHFKLINDTQGHDKGDILLQEVAQRLLKTVRAGDTVARLGGDEFVVLLEELSPQIDEAASQADAIAQKILATVNQTYTLDGNEIKSSCSIGVVLFTDTKASAEDLMKHADLAMYQAKESGRHAARFFDPEMHAAVIKRVALEKDLRTGLQQSQLFLLYQAQVNNHGHIVGAEALVRWQHPQHGMVSPAEFIPLAEDSGLILPLGQWVLQAACKQLACWAQEPMYAHLTLAVNVSGRQLRQPDFVQQVLKTLENTGAPAKQLKLELTESLLLDNPQDAITKMVALKAHGVGFSLDDFGTGYSSLAYLRRLPLSQLKIDSSFVRDLVSEPRAVAIVRTIVTLADSLGLQVIAEGVETQEQRDSLARNGCHAYQGYLFSRPGTVEELYLCAPDTSAHIM
ncbi:MULTISPECIES: bifunctional diguanylate cyclase/phosphodiesterase [Giesbergeria]|uniref:EAL domain-containing protein n=1 Tax=Giesbergeria sinuosa TaxID=80883 RepID=A0ABV9QFN3_9BURK